MNLEPRVLRVKWVPVFFFFDLTPGTGRYAVPPYWSLGFHLCRYGYDDLETMQETRDRMREEEVPQDSQWGDIDVMEDNLDFTISQDRCEWVGS